MLDVAPDFYALDPSVMWALELKQTVEEGVVPYRNSSREIKEQKSQAEIMICSRKVTANVPAPPASPSTSPPTPPPRPNQREDEDEGLCADPLPLRSEQLSSCVCVCLPGKV